MSDTDNDGITERQAEARRKNGAQSRGPVTEEGKRISSQNATRHGVWSIKVRTIERGPLREDPEEMGSFIDAFVDELDPGDSLVLRQLALDAAVDQWKKFRAQRWEAEGYSAPDSGGDASSQADWLRHLAAGNRKAADVIRRLVDGSVLADEVSDALSELGLLVKVPEEVLEDLVEKGPPEVAAALYELIAEHFKDADEAAASLERRAYDRENEAAVLHAAERPRVVRQEVNGPFAQNVVRLLAHTSREVDRSLKRYFEMKERMQMTQQPPLAQSAHEREHDSDIGTDQDRHVTSTQSRSNTDAADTGMDTDGADAAGWEQSEESDALYSGTGVPSKDRPSDPSDNFFQVFLDVLSTGTGGEAARNEPTEEPG